MSAQLGDGVVGLGYVERVSRSEIDVHWKNGCRRMGKPTSKCSAMEPDNEWLYVVVAIEPRGTQYRCQLGPFDIAVRE